MRTNPRALRLALLRVAYAGPAIFAVAAPVGLVGLAVRAWNPEVPVALFVLLGWIEGALGIAVAGLHAVGVAAITADATRCLHGRRLPRSSLLPAYLYYAALLLAMILLLAATRTATVEPWIWAI